MGIFGVCYMHRMLNVKLPETDVALEFLRYVHISSSLLQLFTALESLFMLGIMAFNEGQNDLVSHNKIL